MDRRYMILPAARHQDMLLLSIPDDLGVEEAYRIVTGLIAEVEEGRPEDYARDDIIDTLEDHGFVRMDFELGPELDLQG